MPGVPRCFVLGNDRLKCQCCSKDEPEKDKMKLEEKHTISLLAAKALAAVLTVMELNEMLEIEQK